MAKSPDLSWHEYLRGYGSLKWRAADHERRFHETLGLLQPLYALRSGRVIDSKGPKVVVAEETQPFARRKGHPPFCFVVYCLTTGRKSTFIPYERYIEFGILTSDAQHGGPFPTEPPAVVDRIGGAIDKLQNLLEGFRPAWSDPTGGLPWPDRYAEYLQSYEWLDLRERVLQRDRYRCTVTGKAAKTGDLLQVHHLTYERVGCELMEDLITVCRSAHEQIHGRSFSNA